MTTSATASAELELLRQRRSKKWTHYPGDVIPAWIAEMDFPVAEPIARCLIERIRLGDLGYPSYGTDHPLPRVFADWVGRQWDWAVDPAAVTIIPDVMRGIEMCLLAFSEAGDKVVVTTPIYPPFLESIADYGRVPVHCGMLPDGDGWCLDLDAIQAGLANGARLIMLCSPHNPTGHVPTRSELQGLAQIAVRYGATIVSDEVHAPLVYDEATHVPIATLGGDVADRCVTLLSASKSWNLPGLRCAQLVAPSRLSATLAALPRRFANGVSNLGMEAATAAFEHGAPWLSATRAALDRNRRLLRELLQREIPQIRLRRIDASYLAWLDCSALGWTDPAAVFLEHGVALNSGLAFGPGGQGCTRLNFATSEGILHEIVDRMAAAVSASDRG